ncbi:MAG: hypothetical protein NTY20_05550 [Candidatus Aenigmarchaeota archaeon]|nr:hypothetical protein [Candidatus Aenigmarchaeota archaeon]
METDIFGYGVAKVTEGLEMLDSIYRNLADMYTDNYRQIKGFLLEEDTEIFPEYCELDDAYRKVVKDIIKKEGRELYFCKGCGMNDCIGNRNYEVFRTEEQENRVREWEEFIKERDRRTRAKER